MAVRTGFIFLFVFLSACVLGQVRDTFPVPKTYSTFSYTREQLQSNAEGTYPDTLLDVFHRYNPAYRSFTNTTLGNTGLAAKSLVPHSFFRTSFVFREDPFAIYQFHPDRIKYYDTRTPYTDINYTQAGKKEQFISLSHSRSFKKYFNAGFDLQKIKTQGLYKNQEADYGGFDFYARYTTKDQRYLANTAFIRNKAVVQENGGVDLDSIPAIFSGDKLFYPVWLQAATNSLKVRNLFLDQTIFLGKRVPSDSLHPAFVDPTFAITHSIELERRDEIYSDLQPNQEYYPVAVPATGTVYDSIGIKNVSNTIKIKTIGRTLEKLFSAELFFRHETSLLGQELFDTSFVNTYSGLSVGKSISKWSNIKFSGQQNFTGYYKGDSKLALSFSSIRDSLPLEYAINIQVSKREPDMFYKRYASDLFNWRNDTLAKVGEKSANFMIGFFKSHLQINLRYSEFSNFIVLDQNLLPYQDSGKFNYLSAGIHAHLIVWKKWNLVHDLLFQQVSDTSLMRLPQYFGRLTYYYHNRIFKKKLEIQAGFELNYSDFFFSDAYMPALRSFYLQDNIRGGGYPFVDVFFKFKVKNRARIFFKMEHVNSGFVYRPSMLIPVYPQADRVFKMGVNWKFFD